MDECNILAGGEEINAAQACRRRYVADGGALSCDVETGACVTPQTCVDATSDDAQCFLTCQDECAVGFASDYDGQGECGAMCATECGRLLEAKGEGKVEGDGEGDGENAAAAAAAAAGSSAWTEEDVAECVMLCNVASECPAVNQAYEFDARTNRAALVTVTAAKAEEDEDWHVEGSAARERVAEGLSSADSPEAVRYEEFIEALQAGRGGPGGGDDGFLPEGMSVADLMSAMGIDAEGVGGMGEAEVMALLHQMMGGGGGGYGGGYGDYGGGEGYGMGYGGSAPYGGVSYSGAGGYEEAEVEDDFEE